MLKLIYTFIAVGLMTGCTQEILDQAPPTSAPEPLLVFEVPLLGAVTKKHFATLSLYRDAFTQTRLVIDAFERLQNVSLAIALPNCLSPTGINPKTTWEVVDLEPNQYQWVQRWRQTKTKCVGGGTVLYTVSGKYNGDRGNIPFEWPIPAD